MDRSLKERLAGAVVLVALAVWLIPQVLDGPEDGSGHSQQTLTLPAPAEGGGLRTQTIRLDEKRALPTAKPAAPQTQVATSSKAAADRPVKKPTAEATKATAGAGLSKDSGWFVQLGSFAERDNAKRLADTVAELGFKAEVSRFTAGSSVLHRVRVGPRPSRVAAEALASDLARRGYPGQVVQDG